MKTTPFWTFNRGKIEIDEIQLVLFLKQIGYSTYQPVIDRVSNPLYINAEGNIIELVIPVWIHKAVITEIENGMIDEVLNSDKIKKELVLELIRSKTLLKQEVLTLLDELNKPIISDTKDSAYFFFKNTGVCVTKDGIKLFQTDSLDKYVWNSQIIQREFNLKDLEEVKEKSEYYQFLRNITSTKSQDKWEVNKDRLDNLMTLQGYLLHGYMDRANAKAVALMDASEIGEPNGRTGKGLFVNGLSKLKKTVTEDGKSFKDDNRFKFSQVTPDTKILFINDVKENFNFENFFPTITDGIAVEVKFENKKSIPFEDSPKIVISTNYAILGRGSSFEDRIYEFELSNYYSIIHRPKDDFKHLLFDEWDSDQWDLFYSLMLYSVKEYMNKGVVKSEGINLNRNKLIAETNHYFVEWASNINLKPDHKYDKKELYKDFCSYLGVSALMNEITQLIFTKYLKTWARHNNLEPFESHSNVERTIEFQSK